MVLILSEFKEKTLMSVRGTAALWAKSRLTLNLQLVISGVLAEVNHHTDPGLKVDLC